LASGSAAGNTPYWNGSSWVTNSSAIFNNGGNIGIGTTSPNSLFHVVGSGSGGDRNNMIRVESDNNASLTIKNTNASAGGGEYQLFASSSASNSSLGAGSFAIYYDHPSNAAYRFSINSSGSVGIGTGMPTEKLDVAGNLKTSGTIRAGSITYPNTSGTNGQFLTTDGTGIASWATIPSGGVTSVGTISGSSTANGASITSGVLNLAPADATNAGVVTAGAQTIAGAKTFSSAPVLATATASQALFTDANKNMVSNAITGTGNVVMSTSPSLTTPNLGTPSSLTLTNATGLPISTGITGLGTGVATFLGTPSSANLAAAVTGETGSGAAVFAISPTLTTPNLGTPSALTLSNATGLPLTSGVTGILPEANGGTGSSTKNFVDLSTDQLIGGVKTFSGNSTVIQQNLTVNSAGTSGQGIILSDDGDIVDNNDGAATFRFSGGVRINNGNKGLGTTTNITLSNTGNITAAGSITGSQFSSNVATGTAPLVVASTTPVTNLSIGGNAATATKLATARNINGVAFDGSSNVTVTADAGTLTGTTLASNVVSSSLTSVGTISSGTWNGTTIAVAKGGTGLTSLGSGVTTFLATPSSANLAATLTDETGSGAAVFANSPTLTTPTVTSGNIQFPISLQISPTSHATSKRAAIWLDGWSILQDVIGDGTKNFSIGETVGGTYPPRLVIGQGTGKIGIGTSAPTTALHIQNGNTMSGGDNPAFNSIPSIYVLNDNNASSNANSIVSIRTGGSGGGKPYLSFDAVNFNGYSIGMNNPTDQFIINTDWNFNTTTASKNAVIINETGQSRVIIPNSSGTHTNDWPSGWGGGISTYDITASGIYYQVLTARSDQRLKNSINSLDEALINKYLALRPVSYFWNKGQTGTDKVQYGLIAQEVETILPELVSTATDSMQTKSVNYQALHALSIKVIQSQQAEIDALKKNQEELSKKQSDLERRLLELEAKIKE
jgi:hypothetical protein